MDGKPVCLLVIGMAGSGKTTLLQRLAAYGEEKGKKQYLVNLDPAVKQVPFGANIDIRDTVNYKQVMSEYGLGPNGAIMTSLNLFATRFDQVLNLLVKRAESIDYAILDTPGQIEAFTWSASGAVITESLATAFPTVMVYVVDTPRTCNPNTFMSNMLYACSIMYKVRLPFVVVFNKTDVMSHDFAVDWMTDFESFQTALDNEQDESYMNSLTRSMSLVLEEFYRNMHSVGVSAATGDGMDQFYENINQAAESYKTDYLPDLQARMAKQEKKKVSQEDLDMQKLIADMSLEASKTKKQNIPKGQTTDL